MRKSSDYNPAARFQNIAHACRTTGLSQYYLRNGCKAGTVPHVKQGRVYMVDVKRLYEVLERQQKEA